MKHFSLFSKNADTGWFSTLLCRSALVAFSMFCYGILFPRLIDIFGDNGRIFTAVFVLPAAAFWGLRSGLIVSLLSLLLDLLLGVYYKVPLDNAIGPVIMFSVVTVIGRFKDLGVKLREQLEAREFAEKALLASEEKNTGRFLKWLPKASHCLKQTAVAFLKSTAPCWE